MGPDPKSPRRPHLPAAHAGSAPRPRSLRPPGAAGPSRRVVAAGERIVERLLATRLRVCRDLGVSVPERLRTGPPETLLLRLTGVDRRLSRELDARGGVALPAWSGRPDPLDLLEEEGGPWEEEEEEGDDDDGDDDLEEQGEPAWAA